jgi:hypothetical protein
VLKRYRLHSEGTAAACEMFSETASLTLSKPALLRLVGASVAGADRYGTTQVKIGGADSLEAVRGVSLESVVSVTGTVRGRPHGQTNGAGDACSPALVCVVEL